MEYSYHNAVSPFTLSLLFCCFCSVNICLGQIKCPPACKCFGLSVDCRGDNSTLPRVVQDLPAVIESFRFTVHPWCSDKRNIIDLGTVQGLGKFKNLRRFQVQPNSQSAPIAYNAALEKDIFCKWVHLKEIHLNLRAHYYEPGPLEPFSCLQHLQVLDLSYSRIIPDSILRKLLSTKLSRHITFLLLRTIQMINEQETTEIHFATLFSNLNRSSIEVIDLSANAIRSIYPGLLLFPNLKKLDLSENLLIFPHTTPLWVQMTMAEAVLHPSIEDLSLTDPGVFVPGRGDNTRLFSKRVSQLLANCSHVSNPSSNSEDEQLCSTLRQLTESFENSSHCLFDLYFPIGRHLRVLSVTGFTKYTYPVISHMLQDPICFDPGNVISKIDISNNHFAQFIDKPTLSNVSIIGLTNIKYLNLRNNDFMLDNFNFFHNMASLEQLLLGGNQVRIHMDSQNELFKSLRNLSDLDISHNNINAFPYAEFAHLSKLQRLDLSGNKFRELNVQLPNSSSLRVLNLSANGMTTLQASMADQFDSYPNLEVDLQDNDFICNCNTLWFVRWVQTTTTRLTMKDALDCYTEEGHMPIAKINLNEFFKRCHPMSAFEIASISASVVFCFIMLIIGLIVVYRKRWRIRHYWYRRRLRQERFALNDDFEYDAYVSYSDCSRDVRGWVSGALQEELECRRGLRLFIHQRDLLGGGFFLERIDAAMRKCRKTILVLSPEFLQSRTCLYEAWSAHTSMVTENRDAVVLVKLQSLPLGGITGTLASLMQIRECLTWTEDPIGQTLFWERLEDTLVSVDNPMMD